LAGNPQAGGVRLTGTPRQAIKRPHPRAHPGTIGRNPAHSFGPSEQGVRGDAAGHAWGPVRTSNPRVGGSNPSGRAENCAPKNVRLIQRCAAQTQVRAHLWGRRRSPPRSRDPPQAIFGHIRVQNASRIELRARGRAPWRGRRIAPCAMARRRLSWRSLAAPRVARWTLAGPSRAHDGARTRVLEGRVLGHSRAPSRARGAACRNPPRATRTRAPRPRPATWPAQ
jgi:hypothetical protein